VGHIDPYLDLILGSKLRRLRWQDATSVLGPFGKPNREDHQRRGNERLWTSLQARLNLLDRLLTSGEGVSRKFVLRERESSALAAKEADWRHRKGRVHRSTRGPHHVRRPGEHAYHRLSGQWASVASFCTAFDQASARILRPRTRYRHHRGSDQGLRADSAQGEGRKRQYQP
jgi:hypothetical protein